MHRFLKFTTILIMTVLLSACASQEGHVLAGRDELLLPLPPDPIDPDDVQVRQAINAFLEESGGPVFSKYAFHRVDLNNDKRRDALVLFRNPYGYWCDRNGCTMLVMKAHDDHFTLVNAVQPVRGPVYVSDTERNGWKTLITRVSGRWSKAKDVALQFDGKAYPKTPDSLPPYLRLAYNGEQRVFHDEGT